MLELRPNCECCDKDLPPDAADAMICTYECTWSVFSKPSGAPDPDDPCGGECCSGFQIMIPVAADGSFDATAITCVAPG